MKRFARLVASAVICVFVLSSMIGCDVIANKVAPPGSSGAEQEIISRTPLDASSKTDVVTSVLTLRSGATTGEHVHIGLEVSYVLTGDIEVFSDGESLRYFSAGDSVVLYRDEPHTLGNLRDVPATILMTLIVDADKPATVTTWF